MRLRKSLSDGAEVGRGDQLQYRFRLIGDWDIGIFQTLIMPWEIVRAFQTLDTEVAGLMES